MSAHGTLAQACPGVSLRDLFQLGLRDPNASTLLFGSHARGDVHPDSDVDVLQLAGRGHAYNSGALSVTGYRKQDLLQMARRGSLFVLHLRTDGLILRDDEGDLGRVLRAWTAPRSYEALHLAVRASSGALAVTEREFSFNAHGFMGLITFLMRTEVYARCATQGVPEFSVVRAAARCGVPEVGHLLDQRRHLAPSWARFVALRQRMQQSLAIPCVNPFGSLEALVVHLDAMTPVGAAMVLRTALGAADISYHRMPLDEVPW